MRINMSVGPCRVPGRYIIIFRDAYEIKLGVWLTEEEKFLIKHLGLENHLLFSIPHLDDDDVCRNAALERGEIGREYRARYFFKEGTSNLSFERLIDAKAAMPVIEESFRLLKSLLEAADMPDSRTLEL